MLNFDIMISTHISRRLDEVALITGRAKAYGCGWHIKWDRITVVSDDASLEKELNNLLTDARVMSALERG